jgi:hypothetical protein
MKSILYAGATLMIGAAIYGFVDYKKTSHSKEFTKMYDAKETTEPAVATHKTKDMVVQKETTVNEKITVTKDQPVKKIIPETKTTTISSPDESSRSIKYNTARRKKLSYRLFSRAPLEEKYIDKELKVKEPEKTEIKEQ